MPEPEAIARLEAVAAKAYGVADGSMVASVPGTQLLISLLPQLSSHAWVAILGPTYGEYARSFEAAGRRVVEASTLDALFSAIPIIQMVGASTPARCLRWRDRERAMGC